MQSHAYVQKSLSMCSTQLHDAERAMQRLGRVHMLSTSALPLGFCFTYLRNAIDGAMELQGRAHMLSNMRYHTSVVIYLFAALGTLGVSSRKLMKLSAYSDRITELEATIKDVGSGKTGESWQGPGG